MSPHFRGYATSPPLEGALLLLGAALRWYT